MVVVQNAPFRAPVTLGDTTGNPKTGVAYGSVTVACQKQGGASYTKTLGGTDWYEISSSGMPGVYDLQLSSTDLDTYGFFKYSIKTSGSPGFNGILEVQPYDLSGVASRVGQVLDLLGTPLPRGSNAGTVSQDVDQIITSLGSLNPSVDLSPVTNLIGAYNDWTDRTLFGVINYGNDKLGRIVGMLHENSVLDMTTHDSANNMLSGRLRIYDTKTNALAAKAASPGDYMTGCMGQYSIVCTYQGTNLLSYTMVRELPAEDWDVPWPPSGGGQPV